MASLVGAALLAAIAVASLFVGIRARTVTRADRDGPYGEYGWRDRHYRLAGGAIDYYSASFLSHLDAPTQRPYVIKTGLWVDEAPRGGPRLMPRLDLAGTFFWRLPLWLVIAPLAITSLLLQRRARRLHRLRIAGLCPACGYDLRATPQRCPECGALPRVATAAA